MSPAGKTLSILGAALIVGVAGLALGLVPSTPVATPEPPPPVTPPPVPPPPPGSDTLTVTTSLSHPAVLHGSAGETYLHVEVAAKEAPGEVRMPMNLALVIDRSGSMHGEKLRSAKAAARHVVDQLGPEDRLALVGYGSDVDVLVPSTPATEPGKARLRAAIRGLWDAGGTNLSGGLGAGAAQVERGRDGRATVDRVILISDGQANEGITARGALGSFARGIASRGISVSSIGVGTDFNEDVMQDLAELAAGRYHYLRNAAQLAGIFEQELKLTASTVARAPQLAITLPAGVQLAEVYGYKSERRGDQVVIELPDFPGGTRRKIVARLTVATDTLGARPVADARVSFTDLLRDRAFATVAAPTLLAEVTSAPEVVAQREDKRAFEEAVRVNSASALRKAAEYFNDGKKDEAQRTIAAAAAEQRAQSARLGSARLARETDELDRRLHDFSALDVEGEDGRDAVKAAKSLSNELSW